MRWLGRLLLFLFFLAVSVLPVLAQKLPDYSNYVNDFADVYSPQFELDLNQQLSSLEASTSSQVAVVTIKSLEGLSIEEYAVKLFEKWGIGQKGQDNGLLLLIAPDDREVRFEVGYGLEPIITDGRAGEIIRNIIFPEFKKGDYQAGTQAAINQVKIYLAPGAPTPAPSSSVDLGQALPIILIILFSGLPIYLLAYLSRSKEFFTGGVAGLILGLVVSGVLLGLGLGIFGLLLDFILSRNYKNLKSQKLPTNFWGSRGGFWSGGRSGGGGFSGFGGGRSGGGGASGKW
ncbi:MAG: TPM domain-containing protein [Candidatus Shapirobacteria bacterium]|jgi:uncharacterized protein